MTFARPNMIPRTSTWLAAACVLAIGCKGYEPREEKLMKAAKKDPALAAQIVWDGKSEVKLGGKQVHASTLTRGREGYMLYCFACHGQDGDGKGPSAPSLRPPPRNFQQGLFKFAAVPGGTLPHDEDLLRIVKAGLHGTAMLPWDIPEPTLADIVQYIKTFSPKWKEEEPGEQVKPSGADPWQGKVAEGVHRGKKVYHGLAQCLGCHPAYASKQEISDASMELTKNPTTSFREEMYSSELKESDYGVKILPPDFLRHEMRSIRPTSRVDDLFRVIASGVGGTAMPTWKNALPDDDLWALAHYVDSLAQIKGTPAAAELVKKAIAADETWKAPPAPAGGP
jgi:mono/diheme cytochrome c family protein